MCCRITLNGIDQVYVYIFWHNFISLKKERISSILIFSNRSFILFTLKRCFLMWVKVLHSMRTCLTMQDVCHIIHWGCCSGLSIKMRVNLVWPMRNWDIVNCSFLDFLNASLQFPKVGLIKKSLLWMLLFYLRIFYAKRLKNKFYVVHLQLHIWS